MPPYWKMFEPRFPNFSHIDAPVPLRSSCRDLPEDEFGIDCADLLEEEILERGPGDGRRLHRRADPGRRRRDRPARRPTSRAFARSATSTRSCSSPTR